MNSKRVFAVIIAFCIMFISGAAFAQETVRVGWFPHPGGSELRNGVYTGYNFDYLREIAKHTGWKYEFVETGFPEYFTMLEDGRIDIIGSLFYNEERAKIFDFPKLEYGHTYTTLFTSQQSKLLPYDFEKFNGMTVAVLRDAANKEYLREFAKDNDFTYKTVSYATQEELMRAVLHGETDAGLLGAFAAADVRVIAEFSPLPYYFATTKGNKKILVGLNRALNMIRIKRPYLEMELYKKHFAAPRSLLFSEAELSAVEKSEREPITVGVISDNPPQCSWDEKNHEFAGIYIEMMKAISQKTGLQFIYKAIDLKGAPPVTWLKQGKTRLVTGILKTQNFVDDSRLALSQCIQNDALVVIGRKGHDFTAEPSNMTIAVLQGFQVADEYIAERFPKHRVMRCVTQRQCMSAVMDGKADATVYLRSGANYLLQDPHYEFLELIPAFSRGVELCAAGLQPESSTLISIIDKGMEMIPDDESNNLVMNYTVMHPYQLTLGDIFYKYRTPLAVIFVLALAVAATLATFLIFRRRSAKQLMSAYEHEKKALQLAEKASAAKGNFMSRMSHEIRTPLNAIIGYNAMARSEVSRARSTEERGKSDAMLLDCLAKSDVASRHLMTVINDILDMSAIESEKIQVADERFDFKDMVATLNAIFSSQAAQKGVDFRVDYLTPTGEWFTGDQMRINQVLTNLLSNAVKFTPRSGRVRLNISQKERDSVSALMCFEVTDTGIGMDEEYLTHIWAPFEQANSSISRRFGGTGLGLSITKSLVDLMGGSIAVESETGEGTTFKVEMPLKLAEPPETAANDNGTEGGAPAFSGEGVLLAEDNAMNMEIATHILTSSGLTADCAWNGKEAADMFIASPVGKYKAILMDIQMPVMDGYQAARLIRTSQHPEAGTIPIIAMTAEAFAENVADALAAGMNGHIAKPVDVNILLDTLRRYIPKAE